MRGTSRRELAFPRSWAAVVAELLPCPRLYQHPTTENVSLIMRFHAEITRRWNDALGDFRQRNVIRREEEKRERENRAKRA